MTDNITLPREVVKFVLQHLEWWSDDEPQEKEAIAALRKALAAEQPKQEPVVWWDVNKPLDYLTRCENGTTFHNQVIMPRHAVAWAYTNSPENIEALRRDAERYEWLKAKVEDYDGHACFPQVPYPAPIPDCSPFDAVDAAIDAAMKEGT